MRLPIVSPLSSTSSGDKSSMVSDETHASQQTTEQDGGSKHQCQTLLTNFGVVTDSLFSEPDTAHNKGAIAFMKLVEENLEKAKARDGSLAFPDLVLHMLD